MSRPRRSSLFLVLASTLFLPVGLSACGSDDDDDEHDHGDHDHGELPPACKAIMEACHEKDPGDTSEVNACHTLSHDGVVAACEERQDCIDICNAAPFPNEGDGGT